MYIYIYISVTEISSKKLWVCIDVGKFSENEFNIKILL